MGTQEKPSNQKERKSYNTFLKYSGLGLQMVVTLGLAGALGYWIDQSIGIKFPVFLLTFLIISLIGSLFILIKSLQD